MGWCYYLGGTFALPLETKCIRERSVSPRKRGEEVDVLGLAKEDDCMRDTRETVQDWH